ncbi:chemotaxis response regulator protein-glutamate methylesterase [Clostridium homopropionicum DSM 5847]|uniref:Protein-glutamate methylesterase/protein-glutamine glutaminase n=1 Tax=Clostridium homopropionicum DSM 5847 TaxID=1121318 RepID=A0A0L6ZDK8_9CLOT|nr:chemotaxis response regulator protein-glutamate methylesterase [Clostridium homopropionicum]KOA21061.1 chemotaxis response regulator protein-glutamate methylesterase [Clostridium homopropionicum DSM 5847]SFF98224.1 two-component system, chemotaxis family, response regulator CheB [Clostridium homopropionicum]
MKKIRVIVVDDSALMRKVISDIVRSQEDMEVISTAKNGEDLLEKVSKNLPDVITLDVEMPKMDGITTLKEMKLRNINVPIIMLSSISKRGTALTMECLEKGAFDFIPKPSGAISLDIEKVSEELISKIRLAANKGSSLEKTYNYTKTEVVTPKLESVQVSCRNKQKINAVLIGASTGGPKALYKVITELPADLDVPVFVVQHMPVGFTKAFAERLDSNSKIKVVEASQGDNIEKNVVYIAPGGYHMEIGFDKRIHLNTDPTIWGVRPAVDKLFSSAVKVYGSNLLSVVLTGMGRDGAEGTIEVKNSGGITISEDKSTCTIYGMPRAAFETGKVDEVIPLHEISKAIVRNVKAVGR